MQSLLISAPTVCSGFVCNVRVIPRYCMLFIISLPGDALHYGPLTYLTLSTFPPFLLYVVHVHVQNR